MKERGNIRQCHADLFGHVVGFDLRLGRLQGPGNVLDVATAQPALAVGAEEVESIGKKIIEFAGAGGVCGSDGPMAQGRGWRGKHRGEYERCRS